MEVNIEYKSNRKASFLKKTVDILESTTAHGLPNILRSERKILKLMWLVFFLGSIGGCVYFINRSIIEFIKYEYMTNIDVVYEQQSEFPTVSFCSENKFNESLIVTIIKCQFDFDDKCNYDPDNYFEKFYDPIGGLCYRFNSGRNMTGHKVNILETTNSGLKSGLLLDMLIYLSPDKDFNRIRISIHNSSLSPNSLLKKMRISSGSKNYFEVSRVFDRKLGQPYNKCLKDVNEFSGNKTLINYISSLNQVYSHDLCRRLFINLKFKEFYNEKICSCNITKLENIEEDCIYSNEQSPISRCASLAYTDIALNLVRKELENYCPLECDSVQYEISSFLVDYPSSGKINDSEFNSYFENYETLRRFYFGIRVYYSANKYTIITQQPKLVLADLISSIGGLFGLFIGVSFLSFAEVFEILVEFVYSFRLKNENRF